MLRSVFVLYCNPITIHTTFQRRRLVRLGGRDLAAATKLGMRTLISTNLARRMNYTGAGSTKYGLVEFKAVCRVLKGKSLRMDMQLVFGNTNTLTLSRRRVHLFVNSATVKERSCVWFQAPSGKQTMASFVTPRTPKFNCWLVHG